MFIHQARSTRHHRYQAPGTSQRVLCVVCVRVCGMGACACVCACVSVCGMANNLDGPLANHAVNVL